MRPSLSSGVRPSRSNKLRAAAFAALESLEQRALMAFTAHVNFQPAASPVPAGFVADAGLVYADRGNGFTYGWDATNTAGLRDRNSATSPDQAYDTLAHTQQNGDRIWNIAVPNGTYVVRIVSGDPTSTDSIYKYNVEGELSLNGTPSNTRRWIESSANVEVTDGKLTITNGAGAANNKINFVDIWAQTDSTRPSITNGVPANGATGVLRDAFMGMDLHLPGGALNPDTVNSTTVKLFRADGLAIPGNVNTSGGGDSIVLQPTAVLEANTTYFFTISSGVQDVAGNAIIPYSMSFTTGTGPGPVASDIQFQKVALTNTNGNDFVAVEIGPDGKLYAGTIDGRIIRYAINADGTLGAGQTIGTIQDMEDGPRLLAGFVFDPSSTSNNLILYVVHNDISFDEPAHWSGKLSKLTGADLSVGRDLLIGLPRANHNHITNQPKFGPDGLLYITQGGNTAQGAADSTWGLRPETLLSAAILRVNLAQLPANVPLNVQTEGLGANNYNPWAANAPLTIYATGVRNAWDIVWTADGRLYAANNGSNPGGAVPATPGLPVPGSIRIDGDDDDNPDNGMYNGPAVPGINPLGDGQNDYFYKIEHRGYYGHPNPTRYEFVLNGGNPTSGNDPQQVPSYPVGTLPDRNYRGAAFDFGAKRSPNGALEYRSDKFGGALQGSILVVRYSGGDDIIVLNRDSNGDVVGSQTGLTGLTGFIDPLDIIEDRTNGNIYVAELGGRRLTLLRPIGQEPPATPANVVASVVTPTAAKVTWNALLGAQTYRIQRRGPGDANFVDYGTSTTNSFDDLNVLPLATYQYRVRGENSFGPGPYSAASSVAMPATGQWNIGVPLPNAMAELGGAIVNGKMYVAGENNTSTWEFDFGTQQWTARAVRPFTGDSTNAEHSTETVGGLLYLIGGLTGGSENKVQIYNPTSNSWSLGQQRSYNAGSSLSAVINGKIYVTGGAVTVPTYGPVANTSVYDPATNQWTALAAMPLPRHSAAAGTDGSKLWVFGGRNAGLEASDGTNTVQVYDPVTNTWQTSEDPDSTLPRMPRPMRGASIKSIYYNGEFYVFGGENSSGAHGATADMVFDRVDIYNPTTRTWRLGEPMPTARHATVAVLHQNKIYLVGGGVERGTSNSNMVEVFDLVANNPPTIPNAPTGLSAVATSSKQVDLSWTDNSTNESGFQVWRSLDGTTFALLGTVAKNVTTYRDTSAQPTTTYHYQVKSQNAAGVSAASNTEQVTTPVLTVPAAPANLVVTPVSPSQLQLTWDVSGGTTTYLIERRGPGQSSFSQVATTSNTTFTDGGLAANQSYTYRVRAQNEVGTSGYGAEVAGVTPALLPFTSADIDASPAGSTTVVEEDKSWNVTAGGRDVWNSSDSFRYLYEQRTGDFDMMVKIPSILQVNISTKAGLMAREGLDPGSRHLFIAATPADGYRFAYRNATGGNTSNVFSGGTPNFPDVYLRMQRSGNTFTGYHSTDGVTWTVMGSRTQTMPETLYFGLAVTARNGGGSQTTTVQFRDLKSTVPAAPANLDAVAAGPTTIDLSWSGSPDATIYRVERRGPGEANFTEIGTTATTHFHDGNVSPESAYTYRVRAANGVGNSPYSLTVDRTTPPPSNPPAAPSALTAQAVSQSSVKLTWQHNDIMETGFQVLRSSNGVNYIPVATPGQNATTYTDNSVSAGQRYFYKVVATNSVGPSAASNTAQAVTPQVDAYTSADISASPAGETQVLVADKNYDIIAGGTDIWDSADSFRYVYKTLSGDFDMRMQIQSLTALAPTTKAGLMVRESLGAGSRHIFSAATATDGFRLSQRQTTDGGSSHKFKGGTASFPNAWVRLKRVGNTFTGFTSTDGVTWTQTGVINMALPTDVFFGMAVTAKSSSARVTAALRHLGTTGSPITSDPIVVLDARTSVPDPLKESTSKRVVDDIMS